MIHVAYDDRLLKWRLGKDHPTNPERAKNAVDALRRLDIRMMVHRISGPAAVSLLEDVHQSAYVTNTLSGRNDEWQGERTDLAEVARLMFQGTVDLVWKLETARRPGVYFSPQGAKHHAMYAQGSGFCVFNDFAWAAQYLSKRGHRVLYVDTDAHHGDGVEALTYGNTDIMTASIHDGTIFPGTGHVDEPDLHVWNWALDRGAGDEELEVALGDVVKLGARFAPTVMLVALGADGHEDDPLSTLRYTYEGYEAAARKLGAFARERGISVLVGGAGGYRPRTHTPAVWVRFVHTLAETMAEAGVQVPQAVIQ